MYQNCGLCLAEKERFEQYSHRARRSRGGAARYAAALPQRSGSNLRSRPCKQACRCALLGYLRRPRAVGAGEKSLLLRRKKQRGYPHGYPLCLAEKERFELSRRLSRPTPLAGAPLRPLEYFSVYGRSPFLNLPMYYTKTRAVCQALFRIFRRFENKIAFSGKK